MSSKLIPLAAIALLALAPAAYAMGQRPSQTPSVAPNHNPNAPASVSEMEIAANHVLILGPVVTVETPAGKFSFVTFPNEAPKSVAQVLSLARSGFYNDLTFHRVVPGFAVQGGDPASRKWPVGDRRIGHGGSGHPLPPEYEGQSDHFLAGTVGMARDRDPNSADSQFFITLQPESFLDGSYTVIGQVTEGMDVLRKLKAGDRMTRVYVGAAAPMAPSPSPVVHHHRHGERP